jgi:hypothetical protein
MVQLDMPRGQVCLVERKAVQEGTIVTSLANGIRRVV